MKNRLKERLSRGEVSVGTQLRLGTPAIAELCGLAGFEWIVLDSEHAPQTPTGIQAQLQAIGNTEATPIVRLPNNDADLIKLYFDMGAEGILAPFITAEEAETGARACRYPPGGTRGWGPSRAAAYGLRAAEYSKAIDDQVMYIPIIESAQAIENIEAIMSVEGVDTCVVGPVDLSISLGAPFDYQTSAFQAALAAVVDACDGAGKAAGIGVYEPAFDPASCQRQIDAGFRLLLVGGDEYFLTEACRQVLAPLRNLES